jgi:hypothetical protein
MRESLPKRMTAHQFGRSSHGRKATILTPLSRIAPGLTRGFDRGVRVRSLSRKEVREVCHQGHRHDQQAHCPAHGTGAASTSQPSREEAVGLLRAGLAGAMRDVAASYVIPICSIAARDREPFILGSGSAFLLDCGAGPFLVTANHVYQGLQDARAEHADTVCIVGELRFDLIDRAIASDSAYDVATFRVTQDEIDRLAGYASGKIVLSGSQASWPPPPPAIGRGVFFVGFPGDGRGVRPYRGGSLVEIDRVGYTTLAVAG